MREFKVVNRQNPREIAARVLQPRARGEYIEPLLDAALAQTQLSSADRHLCQELVYGIVRWQATLDWLIDRKARSRPPAALLQNLLRLGLYQIFWLDRIPNHAAVHETVEQAKHNGFDHQAGFVNALLRGYLREFDATRQLLADLKTSRPDLGYSHPQWLVARWQKQWTPERAAALMDWNNTPPRTFARINALKADPAKLLIQWRDEGVEYDFFRRDWFDENLVFELKSHPPLAGLPSFQSGLFYVQDPSTLLAARELGAQPGHAVLDLCAAPGGKLTYLAQLMGNQGRLVARDTAPERLELVKENCARLGVTILELAPVESAAMSGSTALPAALQTQRFDRILIDAPCSNTGVMRRRVDLRWRIRPEELPRLRLGQLELLRQASSLLKPGGRILYSTCSLEPEENQEVVAQFLGEQPRFALGAERQLLPFADHVDGAYTAALVERPVGGQGEVIEGGAGR